MEARVTNYSFRSRSDYPDLATITSMKRSTQEAGFDTAHLDAFNLYAVLVKHKGKALSDVARVVYGGKSCLGLQIRI